MVIMGGISDPSDGGADTNRVYVLDFDDGGWMLGAAHPTSGSVIGGVSAYDAGRDLFWLLLPHGDYFASYDLRNDRWTTYDAIVDVDIDGASAIDPIRDLFVVVDANNQQSYAFDLTNPNADAVPLDTTGATSIESAYALGFEWDPVSELFVAWNDGTTIYTLTPPSGDWRTEQWVWRTVPAAAGNNITPVRNSNGTYSRFRYAPTINAFLLVNGTDRPVYAYKLNAAAGVIPPRPGERDGAEPDRRSAAFGDPLWLWCIALVVVYRKLK
jgi:hypothetical protein